jgi:hypothetical protein
MKWLFFAVFAPCREPMFCRFCGLRPRGEEDTGTDKTSLAKPRRRKERHKRILREQQIGSPQCP